MTVTATLLCIIAVCTPLLKELLALLAFSAHIDPFKTPNGKVMAYSATASLGLLIEKWMRTYQFISFWQTLANS